MLNMNNGKIILKHIEDHELNSVIIYGHSTQHAASNLHIRYYVSGSKKSVIDKSKLKSDLKVN